MIKIQSINAAIARANLNLKRAATREEAVKWRFHLKQLKKLKLVKKNGRPTI